MLLHVTTKNRGHHQKVFDDTCSMLRKISTVNNVYVRK